MILLYFNYFSLPFEMSWENVRSERAARWFGGEFAVETSSAETALGPDEQNEKTQLIIHKKHRIVWVTQVRE